MFLLYYKPHKPHLSRGLCGLFDKLKIFNTISQQFCFGEKMGKEKIKSSITSNIFKNRHAASNPVGVTKQVKGEPVSIRRRVRFYRLSEKKLVKTSGLLYYMIYLCILIL